VIASFCFGMTVVSSVTFFLEFFIRYGPLRKSPLQLFAKGTEYSRKLIFAHFLFEDGCQACTYAMIAMSQVDLVFQTPALAIALLQSIVFVMYKVMDITGMSPQGRAKKVHPSEEQANEVEASVQVNKGQADKLEALARVDEEQAGQLGMQAEQLGTQGKQLETRGKQLETEGTMTAAIMSAAAAVEQPPWAQLLSELFEMRKTSGEQAKQLVGTLQKMLKQVHDDDNALLASEDGPHLDDDAVQGVRFSDSCLS